MSFMRPLVSSGSSGKHECFEADNVTSKLMMISYHTSDNASQRVMRCGNGVSVAGAAALPNFA